MMRDVHIKLLVVGHRPYHAELVFQVVPDPPVTLVDFYPTLEALRRVSAEVTRIDTKAFQELFARPGQLLHRIEDRKLIFHPQVIEQCFVGGLVYTRLKAPQVYGHPIGQLMVQSRFKALP